MFKQLGEQDASFLYLETPETPQHVGGVSLVELPPGYAGDFYENYKKHIASRAHLIPLLTQKLVQLPFDVDHPFWVEDEKLDFDYHIRRQTVPRPGRLSQLEELVGRLHSNFLDRSRPLWEFYIIDGLESGQVAIYTKIHHAAMDGQASMALVHAMYDPTPVPREVPPPVRKLQGKPRPNLEEVLRGLAAHVVRQEVRVLQHVPELLKAWTKLVLPNAQTLEYDKAVLPPLRTPKTLFNVAITSQRMYAARSLPLARFKRITKQMECKLNDVVLAVCAASLRKYLQDKDALPRQPLTAMVPASLHTSNDPGQGNQNAVLLCTLATDIADPVKRLLVIRDAMVDQKRLLGNIKNALLPDLSFIGGSVLVRGMVDLYRQSKLADRLPPLYNLVISNVAGPPIPLYIAGARVMSMHPCSIPFHSTALNITVQSYGESLDFGLIACRRTVPDLAEFADSIEPSLAELERSVVEHLAAAAVPAKPAAASRARAEPTQVAPQPSAQPSGHPSAKPEARRRTGRAPAPPAAPPAAVKPARTRRLAAKTAAPAAASALALAPAQPTAPAAAPVVALPVATATDAVRPAGPAEPKGAPLDVPEAAPRSAATPILPPVRSRRTRQTASLPNGESKVSS